MLIVFSVTACMPRHHKTNAAYDAPHAVGLGHWLFLLTFCFSFFIPGPAPAANAKDPWKAVITDHQAIPPYFIVVDKSSQELAFFERRSPLQLSRRFACTTGQATGDKVSEGDLKTPEGIYFVGYRIGSGLDFIKYGPEAYTLNYPNPVDRLRKKTGYGIWIHGRGEPLMPLQTEGCVSLNNDDLAILSKALVPGAPVALTDSFVYQSEPNPDDESTSATLRDKVEAWAKAWSNRSHEYFAFYDHTAYGIAQGEPFCTFQTQKEQLFKSLPWIRTTVRDVQVLRGPDYWVTWFYQDYQAPNLQTHGVRRLYWAKNPEGELKILGMEWRPGLDTSTLLASAAPLLLPLEQQGPVWPGVLSKGQGEGETILAAAPFPAQTARTEPATDNDALIPAEADPAQTTRPETGPDARSDSGPMSAGDAAAPVVLPASTSTVSDLEAKASPEQSLEPDSAWQATPQNADSPADHVENAALGLMASPSPEAVRIGRAYNKLKRKPDLLEVLLRASASSAPKAVPAMPGAMAPGFNLPLPLPTQGIGAAAKATPGSVAQTSTPDDGGQRGEKDTAPAPAAQIIALAPQDAAQIFQAPAQPLTKPMAPMPEIAPAPEPDIAQDSVAPPLNHAGAEWLADNKAKAKTPSQPSGSIAAQVEKWRVAWLAGDIDGYMAFYAPKARQGSRTSAVLIRKQKKQLWVKAPPSAIDLADINIQQTASIATVTMRQAYRDSQGGGDYGQKKLVFQKINGVWHITQEDWSTLPDEAGH